MADKDLIDTLIAEAYAEGPEGMRRVAETIINRAAVRGLTLDQVVRQPHQYTGYEHPGADARRAQRSPKARAAAEAALNLALQPGDPTGGADHYLNPHLASPSWASKIPSTGTYGNHQFFASRPIPPGEIANVVGTLTDTLPPAAATPVTPSPDLAQMRRTNMPSRLLPDTFASLPNPRQSRAADMGLLEKTAATPYLKRNGDVLDPAGTVFGKEMVTQLPGSKAVQQSQIERNPVRPAPAPAQQSPQMAGRRATDPTLQAALNSRFPTLLPPLPPARTSIQQSQIDRTPARALPAAPPPRVTVSTPYTTPQSGIERSAARTVTQSPIGQPPATRVVQSVPMPALAPARANVPQSYAGMEGNYVNPDRLLPSDPLPPALYGGVTGVVSPPTPAPRIARIPTPAPPYRAVATDLDVRPMPPMPRPRPDLGMGGVDIPATIAQTGQVAPMPAPRLQRHGMFGRPQIAGHDIPLPGLFGVLQGATMAMNNASGPFNNGADNAMYNGLRGGDFNTPGAATAQSGGYRYAPRLGGGFINVGRVDPRLSGAGLYDSLNRRNEGADDAAARVNGGSTRGGSGASSLSGGSGGSRNRFI